MSTKKPDRSIIGLGIAALVVFGCLAVYALNTRKVPTNELRPEPVTAAKPTQVATGNTVQIARPQYTKGDISYPLEAKSVPTGEDKYVYALTEFLKGMKAVPADAKVKSATVTNGLAVLDFSSSFKHGYSTDDESEIVEGILTTMGQFKEVSKVQFLVEGQTVETLGNSDLSAPMDVLRGAETASR